MSLWIWKFVSRVQNFCFLIVKFCFLPHLYARKYMHKTWKKVEFDSHTDTQTPQTYLVSMIESRKFLILIFRDFSAIDIDHLHGWCTLYWCTTDAIKGKNTVKQEQQSMQNKLTKIRCPTVVHVYFSSRNQIILCDDIIWACHFTCRCGPSSVDMYQRSWKKRNGDIKNKTFTHGRWSVNTQQRSSA